MKIDEGRSGKDGEGRSGKNRGGQEGKTRRQKMRERGAEQKVFGKKVRFFLWLSFCLAMACILE